MLYAVNRSVAESFEAAFGQGSNRISGSKIFVGLARDGRSREGRFDVEWGPVFDWADAILQGPHIGVGTPLSKEPNPTLKKQ